MPRFYYRAKTSSNEEQQGYINAESKAQAVKLLADEGQIAFVIEAEAHHIEKGKPVKFRRVSHREIADFTRQLAGLLESGLSLLAALRLLEKEPESRYLHSILRDVIARVEDGASFSKSLSFHQDIFSLLYVWMVRTGEAAGTLDALLKHLAGLLEDQEEFRSRLSSAMVYPLFIAAVSIGTIVLLLSFVVPRLADLFSDLEQVLPLPTQILMNISGTLQHYWLFVVLVLVIAILLFIRLRKTDRFCLLVDTFKLKIPFWKDVEQKSQVAIFSRVLSTLLTSGVPIVSSLEVVREVVGNRLLKQDILVFQKNTTEGKPLSFSLKNSHFFPSFVASVIMVGEEGGSVDKSLMRLATAYETEVSRALKTFLTVLEPAMILVMGSIVGFIVIAMLLPILQMDLAVH